jgi:RNA polymerase sigma-70 factor (ECF subfamily)
MFATPASLLDRLRDAAEPTAWERFVELYTPLLFHWARRLGLQDCDAADLVQDCFLLLWRKLPEFEYDSGRSFHAWLRTIFLNRHRSRQRERQPLLLGEAGQDLAAAPDGELADAEETRYLIGQAFRLIESEFSTLHQKAFRAHVLEERPPEEIARDLGLSLGTVYSIKSRILSRLRQELRHLLD